MLFLILVLAVEDPVVLLFVFWVSCSKTTTLLWCISLCVLVALKRPTCPRYSPLGEFAVTGTWTFVNIEKCWKHRLSIPRIGCVLQVFSPHPTDYRPKRKEDGDNGIFNHRAIGADPSFCETIASCINGYPLTRRATILFGAGILGLTTRNRIFNSTMIPFWGKESSYPIQLLVALT